MISSFDLELVPKKPMSQSFRSEASTYGTCLITGILFFTRIFGAPVGIHKSFQFAICIEYSLYSTEIRGKMADNNNKDHTMSI